MKHCLASSGIQTHGCVIQRTWLCQHKEQHKHSRIFIDNSQKLSQNIVCMEPCLIIYTSHKNLFNSTNILSLLFCFSLHLLLYLIHLFNLPNFSLTHPYWVIAMYIFQCLWIYFSSLFIHFHWRIWNEGEIRLNALNPIPLKAAKTP